MTQRNYETSTIGERIEAGDELVGGIKNIFGKWENDTQEAVNSAVGEILVQQESKKTPIAEKEAVYYNSTSDGIIYVLNSGVDGEKGSEILVEIDGEKLHFPSFGFLEKGENFSIWIEAFDNVENKIKQQLKNNTLATHKNLKSAIEKMLRHVRSILKSKDNKKQILANEIRKYKQEN